MSGLWSSRGDVERMRLGAILGSGASGEVRLATLSAAEPLHDSYLLGSHNRDSSCLELTVQTHLPGEAAQDYGRVPPTAIVTSCYDWQQQHRPRPVALKCVWAEVEAEDSGRVDVDTVTATGSRRSRGRGGRSSEAQRSTLRHEASVLERLRGCPGVVQLLTPGVVTATARLPSHASNHSVHHPPSLDDVLYSPPSKGSPPSTLAPPCQDCVALGVEFMPGGSLSDLRKRWWQQHRSPLPPSVLRHCMREVTAALACVHGRGVVHGDVKGRNVLLAADGSARLCDFGSASILWEEKGERECEGGKRGGAAAAAHMCPCMHREAKQEGGSAGRQAGSDNEAQRAACEGTEAAEAEASRSSSPSALPCPHRAAGTIFWMSPEAARQLPLAPASDVWSLGCLLIEMASGVPPWSNNCAPVSA